MASGSRGLCVRLGEFFHYPAIRVERKSAAPGGLATPRRLADDKQQLCGYS
jgi:hypothetical protein